jgi:oxygen-dependent protoporphyrinogen oxidase
MRVAVVGGGIAGLAAAWDLSERAEVTVFEPGRLGGRILTTPFGGRPVDEGPDAFLTRVPEAVQLCDQLGLTPELVAPAEGRSAVWAGDRLRPLPDGLVLGVPRDLRGVVRSGILSPRGMVRAGLDPVLPRRRPVDGLTVREMVADRFGTEVADRLVDPLVGGIHAGWTGTLGAEEVTPQIAAVARRSRSLLLGLRSLAPTPDAGPIFLAPRAGVGRLVDRLVEALEERSVRFEARRVHRLESEDGGRVRLDDDPEPYDGAVVAVSGRAAAALLGAGATAGLDSIPTASVVILTASTTSPLPGNLNGFLVPRAEGRLMTACSFGSNKWPHWSAPGRSVVRISAGRHGDPAALELGDEPLVDRLVDELGRAVGHPVNVSEHRVSRWPDAFPQYVPGHNEMVVRVERDLARTHPGVALAGSSYRGSGIPACIASGRRAAQAITARLQSPAG